MIKNHKLAKLIVDVRFAEFRIILEYKAEWYGREIIIAPSNYASSQLCSNCGNKSNQKARGINLHIFVRKYKQIDGVIQAYIYLGKGDAVDFYGKKPITVKLKLENQIPLGLYTEFVKKV